RDAEPALAKPEHLPQPVGRHLLQLRLRRRRLPQHRLHIERRDEHLGDDPRHRRGRGEIAEERRVIPVRDSRNDRALEIVEDPRQRLGPLGRRYGKRGANVAGRGLRLHRILLRMVEVARDPIEHFASALCQLAARQVAEARGVCRVLGHRQRKIRSAIAKQSTVHAANIPSSGSRLGSSRPRSMFARNASFAAVSGSALMKGWMACGKFSDEKNTPDSTHIGSIERFINPDTPSIVFERDAISSPSPPNARALKTMIAAIESSDPRIGTPKNSTAKPSSTPTSIVSITSREITYDARYSARDIGVATSRLSRFLRR